MSIRTGAQFIAGLKDDREVWYDGQRVADVTTFEPFAASVQSLATLYDMQHDPRHRDILSVDCPEFGERIARPFEIPRTPEQLRLKREAYRLWAEATCGMMGRSPDFLNVMMASLAAKRSFFAEFSAERADAIVAYYHHVARNDLFLTHALLDPQLDKGKLRHQQDDPTITLHVKARTREGLIVHGAKRIATAAPYADELLVWPFPPTFQPGEEPYANVFAVPMNTPGLKTICRPSFSHPGRRHDYPLSSQFDEMDATVVFDNVLVPWERVFLHEDIGLLNRMYRDTRMRELTAHQTNVRLETKLGFVYAVLLRVAQAAGIDTRADVMQMLGEAITNLEAIRNTTRSAELQASRPRQRRAVPGPAGAAVRAGARSNRVPAGGADDPPRGRRGLVQLPSSMHEFDSPIGDDLDRALRGAGIGGRDKAQLLRLAWDICGSEFGARHELYEMNYAGDYGALLAGIQREYLRKPYYLAHLDRFLDSL